VAGISEHSNEPAGSIKGGKFFDQLSGYQLLKKDSAPRDYTYLDKEGIASLFC
jgi:hypothetical protein